MRKFKFMSKAVVGMMAVAMTMGSFSGVAFRQPTAVYAAAADVTVTYEDIVATAGTAKENVSPTLGSETGYTITYTEPDNFPYTFTAEGGKITIANTAAVAIPTTYQVPVTITKTDDGTDTTSITVPVTISVKAKTEDAVITAPTIPANLKAGTKIDDITVTVSGAKLDGVGATVASYKLVGFPDGLTITKTDAGVVISGTPSAQFAAGKGYITALDSSSKLLGWVEVNVPAVAPKDNTGGGEDAELTIEPEVSYSTMELNVTTNYAYFTVDVLKSESDKEKPSKSYTYAGKSGGTVSIDLGFLKIKKGNVLNVYGAGQKVTEGKIVKITEQPAKVSKWTVNLKENELGAALGLKDEEIGKYSYRSSFGSDWYELEKFDFTAAKVAGTTIVVRLNAVDSPEDPTKGAPAGPEAKIKIAAAPKAPKVTVDYVKDSVKVTDKMQIALLEGNDPISETAKPEEGGWADAAKGMTRAQIVEKLKIDEENKSNEFTMAVRIAATEKKAASAPVIVTIKEERVLEYTDTTTKTEVKCGTATLSATKNDKGEVTFKAANGDFQYKVSGKWKAIPSKAVKGLSGTVAVRLAPEKAEKNKPETGKFGSNELNLTITEDKKDDTTKKMDTPTVDVTTGEVSVGTKKVVTIARASDKITITPVTGVSGAVEYKKTDGSWASVTAAVTDIAGTSVELRAAAEGEKEASASLTVTVPAAPTVGTTNTTEVSVGGTKVLTLGRKADSKTTITFETASNQSTVVATLEYRVGTTGDWAAIPTNGELADQDNTNEAGVTIQIRIKGDSATKSIASNPVNVIIAKAN